MKKKGVLFLFLLLPILGFAQNQRTYDYNTNTWFKYLAEVKVHKHWGINIETQIRRSNGLKDWQQFLLRSGINYYVNDAVTLTAGYAFFNNYPYGNYPVKYTTPEQRLYQQLQFKQKFNKLSITHRYRMEERWKAKMTGDNQYNGWAYQNRLRYKLTFKYAINEHFFLTAFDEAFVSFGQNVQYNLFSQNRIGGTLGCAINGKHSVEVGYMNQLKMHSDGKVVESNNTIMLTITSKLNFTKK